MTSAAVRENSICVILSGDLYFRRCSNRTIFQFYWLWIDFARFIIDIITCLISFPWDWIRQYPSIANCKLSLTSSSSTFLLTNQIKITVTMQIYNSASPILILLNFSICLRARLVSSGRQGNPTLNTYARMASVLNKVKVGTDVHWFTCFGSCETKNWTNRVQKFWYLTRWCSWGNKLILDQMMFLGK
jgi:hypothetical protein